MELTNTRNNNSLNPMQKLKSSPVLIQFISFNRHDEEYNNTIEYLDVHKLKLKQFNVAISHFKQIILYTFTKHESIKKCVKDCKLCGELIYQKGFRKNIDHRLCSDCYKISYEWIESTLTKKTIPILYLPWWDACDQCTSLKPLMDWISYAQITNLENQIVPIMFIPFSRNVDKCHYCNEPYSITPLFQQKYCKYCLFLYFKYTNNNLDVNISTKDIQCNRYKPRGLAFYTQNIQEWCNSCSEVLYFKQVITNCRFDTFNEMFFHGKQELIESEKHCKLCGKLIYNQITSNNIEFKLCSNCYQIFFEWIESTITERVIPILYLPWWDANNQCISCDQILEFNSSNCQKWCSNCIIIYIGCRYCLTTNIIFGITNQSKCKKCDRILNVDSSNKVIKEVPDNKQYATLNNNAYNQIAHFMNNINEKFQSIRDI
ncbi:hypothetical protein C1646_768124 [Rhizophagus diaphanus]|nr:hypothetical protein C1646_768124 [Rhizophagus diaphanus] [Rhizophagus sp. MUCL 43196]